MEYQIEKLRAGYKYLFQIRSYNDEETSDWSPSWSVKIPRDTSIPGNVENLSAEFVNKSFRFFWNPVTLNVDGTTARDIKEYKVTISDSGGDSYDVRVTDPEVYVTSDDYVSNLGPESGHSVTCTVVAVDYTGNTSITPTSTSLAAPATYPVTNVTAKAMPGAIRVSWDDIGNVVEILRYEIYGGETPSYPDTTTHTNLLGVTTDTSWVWNPETSVIKSMFFTVVSIPIYGIDASPAMSSQVSSSTLFTDVNRDISDLSTQLNAYANWQLNDPSGTTADDKGTGNHDGTYTNGVTLNQTKLLTGTSNCADFDGSNDYIDVVTNDFGNFTTDMSINLFVKPDTTGQQIFITHGQTTANGIPFLMGIGGGGIGGTSAGKFFFGKADYTTGTTFNAVNSTTSVVAGTPYMITGVSNGTNFLIYVNGVLEATASLGQRQTTVNTHVYIGRKWDGTVGLSYDGKMSDITVYKRALKQSEISSLYEMATVGLGVSTFTIKDEGSTLSTSATTLNFVGDGVTASGSGDSITVTVPGGIALKDEGGSPATVSSLDFVGPLVTASGSGGAGTVTISPIARATASVTTASLADLASETGTITMSASYRLLSMTVDRACRVRLYASTAYRTADAARAIGTDPTGDHGLMLEVVMTGAGTLTLTPTVDGFLTTGTAVPYNIQNRSGATSTVNVSFSYIRTE